MHSDHVLLAVYDKRVGRSMCAATLSCDCLSQYRLRFKSATFAVLTQKNTCKQCTSGAVQCTTTQNHSCEISSVRALIPPVWHWGHVCAGKPSPAGDVHPASAQPQSATSANGDPYNDNLQEWILLTEYGNK